MTDEQKQRWKAINDAPTEVNPRPDTGSLPPQRAKRLPALQQTMRASRTHTMQRVAAAPTMAQGREGFTVAIQKMLNATEHERQWHITGEQVLALLLIVVIFLMRVTSLHYNTLYLDEAIYVSVGEDALNGVYNQGATSWMFGSYMYPVLSGIADQLGGAGGVRALSAALVTVAAIFVYLGTLRLFGSQPALWALLIFGLSGVSINLGQQGVYDALSVPLLALAFFFIASAAAVENRRRLYLVLSGVAFTLCVLAKYIGIMSLPALVMFMVVAQLYSGRTFRSLITGIPWLYFFMPIVAILGVYGAMYASDLQLVLTGQFASQVEPRIDILTAVAHEIGLPLLFAVGGLIMLVRNARRQLRSASTYRLFVLACIALMIAVVVMPLYHLATSNIRALSKHDVFSLVFIAPLAGYGVMQLIHLVRSRSADRSVAYRLLGAAATAISLFLFVSNAHRQNTDFHASWPDATPVLDYLKTQPITPDSTILSSSYAILEYYYDFGVSDRAVWNNVWYSEYEGLTGTQAIEAAIADCAYDLVVLDNFYAPEWAGYLESLLYNNGYVVSYSEMQTMSDGVEIITNTHVPRTDVPCGRTALNG